MLMLSSAQHQMLKMTKLSKTIAPGRNLWKRGSLFRRLSCWLCREPADQDQHHWSPQDSGLIFCGVKAYLGKRDYVGKLACYIPWDDDSIEEDFDLNISRVQSGSSHHSLQASVGHPTIIWPVLFIVIIFVQLTLTLIVLYKPVKSIESCLVGNPLILLKHRSLM